jgi:hypothetical protein
LNRLKYLEKYLFRFHKAETEKPNQTKKIKNQTEKTRTKLKPSPLKNPKNPPKK